jgi:predicted ferric reductase
MSQDVSRSGGWPVLPVLAMTFLVPVLVWFAALGEAPLDYLLATPLPGQRFYLFSKLLGLLALALIWLQLLLVLLRNTHWISHLMGWTPTYHRMLGFSALGLSIIHFLFFFVAVGIRKDAVPLALLVPDFSRGFYVSMVSLGLLGAVLLGVVVIVGTRIGSGKRMAIWLHRAALIVVGMIFVHSLTIGSETRMSGQIELYLFWIGTLVIALGYRFRRAQSKPSLSRAAT